jgi:undecaprenyl-diphosphatase
MSIFQAIILGIVQGLTEYLPISSSAHLVIVPYLLGWSLPADQVFPFDVLVQLGTLVAVIVYFWKDLWAILKSWVRCLVKREPFAEQDARLGWYLILATIPAGILGLLLKNQVEAVFQNPIGTASFLLVTAVFLVVAERFGKRSRKFGTIDWKDALWIGAWQAVSIFPGISRSGSTISGGMTRNLDRLSAARFSFLMSVPVMLAASLVSILDLRKVSYLSSFLTPLVIGFAVAAVVGYFSIRWMLSFVARRPLYIFSLYCVALGALTLGFSLFVPGAQPVATISSSSAAAAPEELTVEYTPSLSWLKPALSQCATQWNIDLLTYEAPADVLDFSKGVALRWGAPLSVAGAASQLNTDDLAIIVNPKNNVKSLKLADLQAIFQGTAANWNNDSSTPIQVWVYSGTDDVETVFRSVVQLAHLSIQAHLAPDPEAMRQAVAADPNAIGFLPAHWLDSSVRAVTIDGLSSAAQPILALTTSTPKGTTRSWLLCLQSTIH